MGNSLKVLWACIEAFLNIHIQCTWSALYAVNKSKIIFKKKGKTSPKGVE